MEGLLHFKNISIDRKIADDYWKKEKAGKLKSCSKEEFFKRMKKWLG